MDQVLVAILCLPRSQLMPELVPPVIPPMPSRGATRNRLFRWTGPG